MGLVEVRAKKKTMFSWFWMFGLISYKFIRLDICVFVWSISKTTGGILLRFKLRWKINISMFLSIFDSLSNSSWKKRTMYLRLDLRSTRKQSLLCKDLCSNNSFFTRKDFGNFDSIESLIFARKQSRQLGILFFVWNP